MDAKSFARGFKASLGARAVHMGASGLLVLLLTRFLLTPTQYGILGSALAVFGVAGLFADLGTSKSAARYVTEYRERDSGQVPYVLRAALATGSSPSSSWPGCSPCFRGPSPVSSTNPNSPR